MGDLPSTLQSHFFNCGVVRSMFLPSWLMTVFSADFHISVTGRLLDVMLVDGWQRPLLGTAATCITLAQPWLAQMKGMESIVDVLKVQPPPHQLHGPRRQAACTPIIPATVARDAEPAPSAARCEASPDHHRSALVVKLRQGAVGTRGRRGGDRRSRDGAEAQPHAGASSQPEQPGGIDAAGDGRYFCVL